MKPKILKVAIYVRVSTTKGQRPENQVADLRAYCAARGWQISREIVDHGFSGGTDKRPGLQDLMALCRARKVDIVVVTKLDRMARSLKHLIAILEEFDELGVKFVSLGESLDLTTSTGKLMFHIVAAFGAFEREVLRERTINGLAHARARGKRLGRPPTVDNEAILDLRRKGLSYSQIQKRLNVSRPAIRRAILNQSPKS